MSSGEELAIQELVRNYREALNRAKAFRKIAATQQTVTQATEYRQQARFEMDKARGYLKHANFLRKLKLEENKGAA